MKILNSKDISKPTHLIAFSGGYKNPKPGEPGTQAVYVLKRDGVPIGRLLTGPGEQWIEFEFDGVIVSPGRLTLEGETISGTDRLEGEITLGAEL